jgi:hypothetical protein
VAAAALGHARKLCLFETVLLAAGAFTSFRCMRDTWFVVLAATAILAGLPLVPALAALVPARGVRVTLGVVRLCLVPAVIALAVGVNGRLDKLSEGQLENEVAVRYPARAADYMIRQGYQGEVYNRYEWGGYLLWRLGPDLTVSMDNRSNVHGDERIERRRRVYFAYVDWESDPEFASVLLVVVRPKDPLALILRHDCRAPFRVGYEDDVAVVFVRESCPCPPTKAGAGEAGAPSSENGGR